MGGGRGREEVSHGYGKESNWAIFKIILHCVHTNYSRCRMKQRRTEQNHGGDTTL